MHKCLFSACFLLLVQLPLSGQLHDYFWVLGEDNGGETYFIEGNSIDFRTQLLLIQQESLYLEMHTTMASICDAEGNLQFYTNGCKIANWQHELMENGNGINPGEVHDIQCVNEDYPWRGQYTAGRQSALVLPLPSTENIYYLFHKGIEYTETAIPSIPLYYTKINMTLNNGLGSVEEKNIIITEQELHYGQLTAVKHANGQDWWIFSPGTKFTNEYYRFLFTENGVIDTFATQSLGSATQRTNSWANFSPDGTQYARYEPRGDDVFLFDFDRETGLLSNFQQLLIDEEEEWFGGVAFSPNSRFLYVASFNFIYQYDTWADDIAASRITIAEYEPTGQFIEQHFWGMQLTPDCRIFVYCNSCDVIHVIHNPDEPGLASNFEQGAIQLAWPIFRSQPHFPNYRLGPVGDEGVPCTPVVSVNPAPVSIGDLRVFPNPARNYVTISSQNLHGTWILYDGTGRQLIATELELDMEQTISLETLPAGLYYWKLIGTAFSGKLVRANN